MLRSRCECFLRDVVPMEIDAHVFRTQVVPLAERANCQSVEKVRAALE